MFYQDMMERNPTVMKLATMLFSMNPPEQINFLLAAINAYMMPLNNSQRERFVELFTLALKEFMYDVVANIHPVMSKCSVCDRNLPVPPGDEDKVNVCPICLLQQDDSKPEFHQGSEDKGVDAKRKAALILLRVAEWMGDTSMFSEDAEPLGDEIENIIADK